MNIALILAGGEGTRLQSDIPKQYIRVAEKMVITYSLETLLESPVIDGVQIVADDEWRDLILKDAKRHGLNTGKISGFSKPGYIRQASIINGLQDILHKTRGKVDMRNISPNDVVLIHDAARPNLSDSQVVGCMEALPGHDGVMPVLPMKDTVYLSEDGSQVSELLERSKVFAGQAPEVFNLDKYYKANMELVPDRLKHIKGSTEPAIMAGLDIALIPGDDLNFKITTNTDLERFIEIVEQKRG